MTVRVHVELNSEQQSLLALRTDQHAVLLGAPGSGKTETLIQLILKRIRDDGMDPATVMMLTADRRSATALRDEIVLRLGIPVPGAMARSVGSLAFEIVNTHRIRQGKDPVVLLTGGEQDQLFAELLADESLDIAWPSSLGPEVRQLLGFRTELRDLWLRAIEYGLDPRSDLAALAGPEDRGEWLAAEQFFGHYQAFLAEHQSGGGAIDSAQLVSLAAELLVKGELDPNDRVSQLKLIVLDDAQETVESSRRLLQAFVDRGVTLVAGGDPDIMTGRFRGALPEFLGSMSTFLGEDQRGNPRQVEQVVLNQVYRYGSKIQAAVQFLTARIGTAHAGVQRRMVNAKAEPASDEIRVVLVDSLSTELQLIASFLRRAFFNRPSEFGDVAARRKVDWSEMAVIVRSRAQIPTLMRELAALEVPVRFGGAQAPIRDEPLVRDLLTAASVVLQLQELDEATAQQLLCGPLGGLEPLELRQLRRMLLLDEFGEESPKPVAERLIGLLREPSSAEWLPQGRIVDRAAQLGQSLQLAADESNLEDLLWGLWSRSRLAEQYLKHTEEGGLNGELATQALDAVVALFTLAARFVERNPRGKAEEFINHMLTTDLPEDNLAPKFAGSAVTLLTPAAAVGTQFKVVVIAQLQENTWPDTRLRDTLLGAHKIATRMRPQSGTAHPSSIADLRTEVIHDELRMFVQAISRASESVLLTATNDEENGPSSFLNRLVDVVEQNPLVDEHPRVLGEDDIENFSLRRLVARLRRTLTAAEFQRELGSPNTELSEVEQHAIAALRVLSAHGVAAAHPEQWYGNMSISSTEPLVDLNDPEKRISVSPSQLEQFQDNELAWAIRRLGGDRPGNHLTLGNIFHAIMEESVDYTFEALWQGVEARWGQLEFEADWISAKEKRGARELTQRLAQYLSSCERDGIEVVGQESGFMIEIGQAQLRGSIDRIERTAEGTLWVVDLKTGSTVISKDAAQEHLQMKAYQLALEEQALAEPVDGTVAGAKLVFIAKKKAYSADNVPDERVQGRQSAEEQQEFRALVSETAIRMAGAAFEGKIDQRSLGDVRYGFTKIHLIGSVSD